MTRNCHIVQEYDEGSSQHHAENQRVSHNTEIQQSFITSSRGAQLTSIQATCTYVKRLKLGYFSTKDVESMLY